MRSSGTPLSAGGLGVSDHLCWVYAERADFAAAAQAFLTDGLVQNERLMYVSSQPKPAMLGELARLEASDRLLSSGVLSVTEISDLPGPGPSALTDQLRFYMAATEQAVADGYAGLRVVAEITDIVAEPRRRPDHVRWEHLAEQYMAAGHPLSAMCAYDARVLATDGGADVAAVHPLVRAPDGAVPFQLFFDRDQLVLAGELDWFSCAQLRRLLAASHVMHGSVTLDISQLQFVDLAGLYVLARRGRRLAAGGGELLLAGASATVRRVWSAMRLAELGGVRFVDGRR